MRKRKDFAGRAGVRGISLAVVVLLAFGAIGVTSASANINELFMPPSKNPPGLKTGGSERSQGQS